MAYYKNEKGEYSELDDKNVDTGMGFERLTMVMQCICGMIDKPIKEASVYDTDIFSDILEILSTLTDNVRHQRIMADHFRTSFWLIQQWLVPSNEWRGYVLRRIIRRAYFVSGLWKKDGANSKMVSILQPDKRHAQWDLQWYVHWQYYKIDTRRSRTICSNDTSRRETT